MKRLAPVLLALACLTLAGHADAKTSRADVTLTPTGTCMIRSGGGIGCFGDAVPAPYGTDGYLWMRKRGKVRRAEAGGFIGHPKGQPVRLRKGDRWVKRGVRCRVIRGGIKCQNRAKRGFRLRKHGYRVW